MKFQFFAIPAIDSEEAQTALNAFCSSHRLASVDKHFVECGNQSYWAICLSYLPSGTQNSGAIKKGKVDYREVLNEQDFAQFVKLRDLRKKMAEAEGVPAYALFTNEQLAEMVRKKITDKTGLLDIEGIGKGKVEKYGDAFLQILLEESHNQENETKSH